MTGKKKGKKGDGAITALDNVDFHVDRRCLWGRWRQRADTSRWMEKELEKKKKREGDDEGLVHLPL